jgi:PAS domain S-box-containing protein
MSKESSSSKENQIPGGDIKQPNEFFIVGIGASAGGVQALQQFFLHTPLNSGIAYVVILHLSPNHDSQLAQVLQHETQMPVIQVTEKTSIAANRVYVVPPDHHLVMEAEEISVLPNMKVEDRRAPVDIFFRSLAGQYGARAISVILSGTGANGSMGLKRIKEFGGATFVQNPKEAEFSEMPRNAIATQLIDEVLNVADIPGRILAYCKGLNKIQLPDEPSGNTQELQQQSLQTIFTQLRLRTGHDFSNYKRPTLLRRIERRISVLGLHDLQSYVAALVDSTEETHSLLKDLLISVTNFFRDEQAFKFLEQEVISALFLGKGSQDQVRIWVAGCATGEEAYSIAMLCAEHSIRTLDCPKIQIFATDIDESAIAIAREGLYTINDAADVSPGRLKQFFTKHGDLHRVKREIREMVLFADHNFLKDPSFSRLDLISCRNVLIYLNSTAQARVAETFHFALKPKGFLFLGTSESVDGTTELYSVYNREHHIYTTREIALKNYPIPNSVPRFQYTKNPAPVFQKEETVTVRQRLSFGDLHQKLLEEYAPPSVVINQAYDIVHMSERAAKYFQFSGGEPTQNIMKLVPAQIRLEMRAALFQAVQLKGPIELHNIRTVAQGQQELLDIHIRPALKEGNITEGLLLIIFKPAEAPLQEENTLIVESNEPVAKHLEDELIALKSQLKELIEHHEYQAEELKASNEELQAMNEELRSAAEELETSKEELQSINEELRTVNQELKVKVEETGLNSNNLQNLINSASVGTIFVDRNFDIRLYTPAVLDIFNLKSGDYGRPVTDITHKLNYTSLLDDAQTVLDRLTIIEQEVTTTDDRSYMMRLLPYRTAEERIGGVVITFFDITKRKSSETALKQSEEQIRMLIEGVKDYAIFMIDTERRVVVWNSGAKLIFGYDDSDMIGNTSDVLFTKEDQEIHEPENDLQQCLSTGLTEDERWYQRKDGSKFWGSGTTQPIRKDTGEITGYVKIMRDLTQQKESQEALAQSEERYRLQLEESVALRTEELNQSRGHYLTLVENTPDLVTRWDSDYKLMFANKALEKMAGLSTAALVGKPIGSIGLNQEFTISYYESLHQAFETGEIIEHFNTVTSNGQTTYFYSRLTPERNAEGKIESVLAIARDITEIKKSQIALSENRDLLQSILDNSSIAMSVLKAIKDSNENLLDFEITLTNKELENQTGRTDLIGKIYTKEYPGIILSGLFDVMVRVFQTGKSEGLEYFYPYEGFNKWYSCMFIKMDDGLLATNLDVTERRQSEELVKSSEQRLRMFVTASSDLIFQMDAGWTQMLVLKSDDVLAGTTSPINEWIKHYIPSAEQQNFQDAIKDALSGKKMFELEHMMFLTDGSVGWANSRAIPLLNEDGDIVEWFGVATDITDKKTFEQERNRSYLLFQQAEAVAGTGTWDFDIVANELSWSDGMYELFGQTKEHPIDVDIYLKHATAECKDKANEIIDRIKSGIAISDETLKVLVKDKVKELKMTAMVIRNSEGTPVRVLGVDMDVTASRKAEERMRRLESQSQLEIFKATLSTQDEERRRISESLHNGLGQLLYSIKLSMTNLRLKMETSQPEQYEQALKYTENLLTEAIRESRSISHELMPTALQQFGLSSAIDDVCRQLNGEVNFQCTYTGLDERLENYLEIAIFRTVQELMLNVVKHSGATSANVSIAVDPTLVVIKVSDNGKGMQGIKENDQGIGLTSIRSKISLLNGKVDIDSKLERGTAISIYIPLKTHNP